MFNFDAYSPEFKKIEERLKTDFDHLRTGRANASILDLVQVEAYGAMTPLKGMASITIPDSKTIAIEPWDKSILKEIEKVDYSNSNENKYYPFLFKPQRRKEQNSKSAKKHCRIKKVLRTQRY